MEEHELSSLITADVHLQEVHELRGLKEKNLATEAEMQEV